ncbi:MAG: beta-glucosidase [Chloroflexi bacterium HGW-Chloroflexi-4]|jgi:beta-glucosidase|nr:MAG: beta-glucosidase [Chloroflexi bacterium HGW-Chloroflexi-4]
MSGFYEFPKEFKWGTATSSYQIEGGADQGGRSPSIWDEFSHRTGTIRNNENGDIACDHYHRWKEDIHLMKELGYKAYRFSVAWPRILPDGRGRINQQGIDFYNRLIDEMLQSDIEPYLTLYHWDIPTKLKGAWLNRDSAYAFEEFSDVCALSFGDRVKNWMTINEPICASFLSYTWGHHAPGMSDPYQGLVAAHHLLLSHGLAVKAIHARYSDAEIGIALNPASIYPLTDSTADHSLVNQVETLHNHWFADPIYKGSYPAEAVQAYIRKGVLKNENPDFIQSGDMQLISAPTDFLGINYYTRQVFHTDQPNSSAEISFKSLPAPKDNQTEMGWEIFPQGLFDLLQKIYQEYKPTKILITENGASYSYAPDNFGKIDDSKRIEYLDMHLQTVAKAIQAGIPVKGYFLWSFMDNFEWAQGYSQRFGLVYVDYKTQKRTPKASAYWYGKVIKENGLILI